MRLKLNEIEQLIMNEIVWCRSHPMPKRKDFSTGFVDGLHQALYLIKSAEKSLYSPPELSEPIFHANGKPKHT